MALDCLRILQLSSTRALVEWILDIKITYQIVQKLVSKCFQRIKNELSLQFFV